MSSLAKDLAVQQEGDKLKIWSAMVKNRLESLFLEERKTANRYGLHASAILASDNEFCYREQVLSLFFQNESGRAVAN